MKKFQPKTTRQLKAIFGLAKKRGYDFETLLDLARRVTDSRTDRLSQITFDEANALIEHLGGEPFAGSGQPRRTVNYQRQQAGIKQIAQPAHLQLMRDLAHGRGISEEGLERMCRRMLKGNSRPQTTDETNKIIEALKAMNARDRVSSPHVSKGSATKEAA